MKDKEYIERIVLYCLKINRYMERIDSTVILEQNDMNLDAIILNLDKSEKQPKSYLKMLRDNFQILTGKR